jgi:DNA-binding NarL/FixJ family response regulator
MAVTVLIVDDHASFRLLARRILESEGYDVVGEAADAEEAAVLARRLHPQLVLVDIQLPGEDGLTLATRLAVRPGRPVVILTSSRDVSDYGPRVAECGARGFIPKAELTGKAINDLLRSD